MKSSNRSSASRSGNIRLSARAVPIRSARSAGTAARVVALTLTASRLPFLSWISARVSPAGDPYLSDSSGCLLVSRVICTASTQKQSDRNARRNVNLRLDRRSTSSRAPLAAAVPALAAASGGSWRPLPANSFMILATSDVGARFMTAVLPDPAAGSGQRKSAPPRVSVRSGE